MAQVKVDFSLVKLERAIQFENILIEDDARRLCLSFLACDFPQIPFALKFEFLLGYLD